MQQYALAYPKDIHAVVLASDGDPEGCARINTVALAGAHAAKGLSSTPPIRTFAIGVGSQASLNTVASLGGPTQAFTVDGLELEEAFLATLDEIRGGLACEYQLPSLPSSQRPDFDLVNVTSAPDGESKTVVPMVSSENDCDSDLAWYYDDPINPNTIVLCPDTCDSLRDQRATVTIELGCRTVPR